MATMIQAAWIYVWPNSTTKFFLDLYAERGCGILVSCLIGRFHDWYAAYGLDEGFSSHSLQN